MSKVDVLKEYKQKQLNCHDLRKLANNFGFIYIRSKGDHDIYHNDVYNKIIVIPFKGSRSIPLGTKNKILKEICSCAS